MKVGYGVNRHPHDFRGTGIAWDVPSLTDGPDQPRAWIDTDAKVRPEFTDMLLQLTEGDVVVVLALSDLGKGFQLQEAQRMIAANGATVEVYDPGLPPPPKRKRGPSSKWDDVPEDHIQQVAERWHNPNIYTTHAAIALAHELGHEWVRRHNLNDRLGPRSKPLETPEEDDG